MAYLCTVCGEEHDDLPDLAADKPDQWWGIPAKERARRIKLTADTCVIDREQFFIRGVIEIPIHDYPQRFGIGVWVSQKRDNFMTYRRHPDTAAIGPFFGWLCTRVAYYQQDTFMLKTMAHFHDGNLRPTIEVEPTEHLLAVDQRHGITLAKAWEIVHHCQPRAKPRS